MLIQVNKKNWIRADDIKQIQIVAANQIGHPEVSTAVNVITDEDTFSELFTSFKDAEKFAAQLAKKINSGEWF